MAVQGPWAQALVDEWLSGKTIKAFLVDQSYTDDADNGLKSQVTELAASGYTAGGIAVTLTTSYDGATNTVIVTTGTIDFGAVSSAAIGGIGFYDVATGVLISVDKFGPVDTMGSGFSYIPDDAGILNITVAS